MFHQRNPTLGAGYPVQRLEEIGAPAGIEVGRRLVAQEHVGLQAQDAGERQPLLLSA